MDAQLEDKKTLKYWFTCLISYKCSWELEFVLQSSLAPQKAITIFFPSSLPGLVHQDFHICYRKSRDFRDIEVKPSWCEPYCACTKQAVMGLYPWQYSHSQTEHLPISHHPPAEPGSASPPFSSPLQLDLMAQMFSAPWRSEFNIPDDIFTAINSNESWYSCCPYLFSLSLSLDVFFALGNFWGILIACHRGK